MNDVKPAITQEEIAQLVELHDRYRNEAGVCADAGAFTAATVMIGAALEAELVCAIRMAEHMLRPADLWPSGDPANWTFGPLIDTAIAAGWFASMQGVDEALDGLNDVRICCVHPAAYIRDGGQPLAEREFGAIFAVLLAVDKALSDVVVGLPDPAGDQ